jgi:lipoprotein-anchoring transpeptidase ErfK/SrfK
MGMMHSAEPGAPGSPQNQRAAAHGVRAFALVALLVCVALLGAGSLIVTALADGLHFGVANVANAPKTSTTNKPGSGDLVGDAQGGPDIIPTCDCQSTQVSSAALQLNGVGREILVSIAKQQLYAYQDGQLQFTFLVATGRPGLPTPVGKWSVMLKRADTTFYSPWPQGSNLYYYPTHIHYALLFHDGGFYLHDSWWRCLYGPGANQPHQVNCMDEGDPPNRGPEPVTGWEYGSHGCVGMHIADGQKLYNWASVGTTVLVVP